MSNKEYKVTVFNTVTKKYEQIAVSEEIYNAFRRTGWNIDDNDDSFFAHEIQISSLIGGKDNSFENFKEFISESNKVENAVIKNSEKSMLYKAISKLSFSEQNLIKALYFDRLTESEYAGLVNTSQQSVNKRKKRILKKLEKLLKLRL